LTESKPIRILLVEDNPGDARLVQLALSEAMDVPFQVTHAERLQEAIGKLGGHAFDAILLDLSLPDSQGLSTVREISRADPTVPIVVLSGLLDESLALEALKRGAQDYLVKGQGDGLLVARAVRYAMERKQTEEELRRARDELELRGEERTAHLEEANRLLQGEIRQRRRVEETLRREHTFSTAVLDTVGALVVVLDTEGRISSFNRACEAITGYDFDEVQGKVVWDLFMSPDEAAAVRTVFAELQSGGVPNHYQNHWLTRTGERRFIVWSNAALRDEEGRIEYVMGTGIDTTERQRAEESERQRMLELAHVSRLSTMGEMATEIAHELNQPLSAIASYSDTCLRILDSQSAPVDDVREALGEISGQALRAGEVIRRLRSFARKETADRAPVSLNDLVRDMAGLVTVEARWHNVDVELDLCDTMPAVPVDKVLIEQVIMNLMRNAIDVMGASDISERRMSINTAVTETRSLQVMVQDTGPGLSDDALARVFQPFYTTKATGMGMGLSISQSIIEAHGGQLWARSSLGKGAMFGFSLPIEEG
jgi:PAS domain S-box-containing protein